MAIHAAEEEAKKRDPEVQKRKAEQEKEITDLLDAEREIREAKRREKREKQLMAQLVAHGCGNTAEAIKLAEANREKRRASLQGSRRRGSMDRSPAAQRRGIDSAGNSSRGRSPNSGRSNPGSESRRGSFRGAPRRGSMSMDSSRRSARECST